MNDEQCLNDLISKTYHSEICSLLQAYGERRGQIVNFEIDMNTFTIKNNILSFYLYYDEFI